MFVIPPKAQSGILTIGGDDVTCHLRFLDFPPPTTTDVDLGTWCDPQASEVTDGPQQVNVEWRNSFDASGESGAGLYDALVAQADGTPKAWVFTPYGASGPKWEFNAVVRAPLGQFQAENPIVVTQTYGVSDLQYTKSP